MAWTKRGNRGKGKRRPNPKPGTRITKPVLKSKLICVGVAAALAESAVESKCEEHKAGPWECTPSNLYDFDGLYDPDFGSDDDFDNLHGDWLDSG
jgi:hypothetical protein